MSFEPLTAEQQWQEDADEREAKRERADRERRARELLDRMHA